MRVYLVLLLVCLAYSNAKPKALRPEEHWRPAPEPIDISKFVAKELKITPNVSFLDMVKAQIKAHQAIKDFVYVRGTEPQKDDCGVENRRNEKVVGGMEAEPHQFPWLVAIFSHSGWFCSGSLISEDYVLTAAHCVDGASGFDIYLGAHNVVDPEPGRVTITSYEGILHPGWDWNTLANDIALIKLPQSAELNENVRTACLPKKSSGLFTNEAVTVTGWGKPSDSSFSISPTLRYYAGVKVMENEDCNSVYGIINGGHLCTDSVGGHGVCNGDSGGPLNYAIGDKKYIQVGVTSFVSSGGCEDGLPHGFSRTTAFLEWLSSLTGIDVDN